MVRRRDSWRLSLPSAYPQPQPSGIPCDPFSLRPYQTASADATTPHGSDEPAWRQAFIAPNGVRFTRTPDRIQRERMLGASNAGVSEDDDDDAASGMSLGQRDGGSDAEAPALSGASNAGVSEDNGDDDTAASGMSS